jgi:hypothetical protein
MAYLESLFYHEILEKLTAASRRYFALDRDGHAPIAIEARDDGFEIVQVIGGFKLLDEVSHERIYWRRDGAPLAPGFYFVKVTAGISARKFNEDAVFRGPFRRRQDAGDALQRFQVRIPFRDRHQHRVPDRPRAASYPAAHASH